MSTLTCFSWFEFRSDQVASITSSHRDMKAF